MVYVIISSFGVYGDCYYTDKELASLKARDLNKHYDGAINFSVTALKQS